MIIRPTKFSNFDTKPGKNSNFTEQAPSEITLPVSTSNKQNISYIKFNLNFYAIFRKLF